MSEARPDYFDPFSREYSSPLNELTTEETAQLYADAAALACAILDQPDYAGLIVSRQRKEGGPAIPEGLVRVRLEGNFMRHPSQLSPFWRAFDTLAAERTAQKEQLKAVQNAPSTGRHAAPEA